MNQVNNEKESPLFVACKEGRKEIVQLLIAANAEFNIPKNEEPYALHLAANGGSAKLLTMLLMNKVCLTKYNLVEVSELYVLYM